MARLEIYWPTSGTKQVFHDVPVNRGVVITEFAEDVRNANLETDHVAEVIVRQDSSGTVERTVPAGAAQT